MQLQQPITITKSNGSTITVEKLDLLLIDDPQFKTVRAFIKNVGRMIVVWNNTEYDAIGDWTQEQAESKILQLLSE